MFKKNIPNMITISRMVTSLIAPILFVTGNIGGAVCLYVYGAVSDFLDGMAARKLNAFTELGRKLDPISDKLYALSLIVPSLMLGNILMLIPILLEGEIAATTLAANKSGVKIETERVGKYKTWGLFSSAILGLMATQNPVLYFPLVMAMGITTKFQLQSIEAYNKQYRDKLNNMYVKEDNLKLKGKSVKQVVFEHYDELNYYLGKDIHLNDKPKRKVRKLEHKK
jgi:phosphatidylglycerophosphate synthase